MKSATALILSLVFTSCLEAQKPEQIAINSFFKEADLDRLNLTNVFQEFFPSFSDEQVIYSEGLTCGISKVGYITDDLINGEVFFKDYKLKKGGSERIGLKIPDGVKRKNWSEYMSENADFTSYFLLVRNNVFDSERKEYIVQLSLVNKLNVERVVNFFMLIKEKRVVKVFTTLKIKSFGKLDFCEPQ